MIFMEKEIITFDSSVKKEILAIFDKDIDKEGYIIEKPSGDRVISPDGDEVKLEDFAGISKGSEVFIKSDITSLIKYSKR